MNKIEKLVMLILAVGCLVLFLTRSSSCNKEKKLKDTTLINPPSETIVRPKYYYLDSLGNVHTVIPTQANVVKSGKENIQGKLDTAIKHSNLTEKDKQNITQVTKVESTTSQENIILQAIIDSLKRVLRYEYDDKWLHMIAVPVGSNLKVAYKVNTNLNWIDYNKRSWFLAPYKSYTDIFADNPNNKINGDINRITIEHPSKQFGIDFKLSTEYSFHNAIFNTGPGIGLKLNRFDLQGYYYYYPSYNVWQPTIKLDYNLISF